LDASRLSFISDPLVAKCFVLKHDNLDKFESRSSDGILLGYTPHDRSYKVFNFETNTVVESYDVIFDETTTCPQDVFECTGNKEMEESIFVDEELQKFDCDTSIYIITQACSYFHTGSRGSSGYYLFHSSS
jgi:hypothetical protein